MFYILVFLYAVPKLSESGLLSVSEQDAILGTYEGSFSCSTDKFPYTMVIRQGSEMFPYVATMRFTVSGEDIILQFGGAYMPNTKGFVFTIKNRGLMRVSYQLWGIFGELTRAGAFTGTVSGPKCTGDADRIITGTISEFCTPAPPSNVATVRQGASCRSSVPPKRNKFRCVRMLDSEAKSTYIPSRRRAGASVLVTLNRQYVGDWMTLTTGRNSRVAEFEIQVAPAGFITKVPWNNGHLTKTIELNGVATRSVNLTITQVRAPGDHSIRNVQVFAHVVASCT